jgi:hypothetical protein
MRVLQIERRSLEMNAAGGSRWMRCRHAALLCTTLHCPMRDATHCDDRWSCQAVHDERSVVATLGRAVCAAARSRLCADGSERRGRGRRPHESWSLCTLSWCCNRASCLLLLCTRCRFPHTPPPPPHGTFRSTKVAREAWIGVQPTRSAIEHRIKDVLCRCVWQSRVFASAVSVGG